MILLNPLTISIKFKTKLNHINFDFTKVYIYNIVNKYNLYFILI